jgi:hypothetical protein
MNIRQESHFFIKTNAFEAHGEVAAVTVSFRTGKFVTDAHFEDAAQDVITNQSNLSPAQFRDHIQIVMHPSESRQVGFKTLPAWRKMCRRTEIRAGVTHLYVCVLFAKAQTVVLCGFLSLASLRLTKYHIVFRTLLKDVRRLQCPLQPLPTPSFPIYDPFAVGYTAVRTRHQELVTWRVEILDQLHSSVISAYYRRRDGQRRSKCCAWHRYHFEPYTEAKRADDTASFVLTQHIMYYFSETERVRYMEAESLLLEIRLSMLCVSEDMFNHTIQNSMKARSPFELLNIDKTGPTWTDKKGVLHYMIHMSFAYMTTPTMMYKDALKKRCKRARGARWITEDALWDWFSCEYYCTRPALLPQPRQRENDQVELVATQAQIVDFVGDSIDDRLDSCFMRQPETHVRNWYRLAFQHAPSVLGKRRVLLDKGNLYVPWFYTHFGFAARFRYRCQTTWKACAPLRVREAWKKGFIKEGTWPLPRERADWIKTLEKTLGDNHIKAHKDQYQTSNAIQTDLPTHEELKLLLPPCALNIIQKLKKTQRSKYKLCFAITTTLLNLGYQSDFIKKYLDANDNQQPRTRKKQEKRRKTVNELAKAHRAARRANTKTLSIGCVKLSQAAYEHVCPFANTAGSLELSSRKWNATVLTHTHTRARTHTHTHTHNCAHTQCTRMCPILKTVSRPSTASRSKSVHNSVTETQEDSS